MLTNLLLPVLAWCASCTDLAHQLPAPLAPAVEIYCSLEWSTDVVESHLAGISLDEPIEVVTLAPGTVLWRWQDPSKPLGHYYSRQPSFNIGVSLNNRSLNKYVVTKETIALVSTAADIIDTWSGNSLVATGGERQYFLTNLHAVKKVKAH